MVGRHLRRRATRRGRTTNQSETIDAQARPTPQCSQLTFWTIPKLGQLQVIDRHNGEGVLDLGLCAR